MIIFLPEEEEEEELSNLYFLLTYADCRGWKGWKSEGEKKTEATAKERERGWSITGIRPTFALWLTLTFLICFRSSGV